MTRPLGATYIYMVHNKRMQITSYFCFNEVIMAISVSRLSDSRVSTAWCRVLASWSSNVEKLRTVFPLSFEAGSGLAGILARAVEASGVVCCSPVTTTSS